MLTDADVDAATHRNSRKGAAVEAKEAEEAHGFSIRLLLLLAQRAPAIEAISKIGVAPETHHKRSAQRVDDGRSAATADALSSMSMMPRVGVSMPPSYRPIGFSAGIFQCSTICGTCAAGAGFPKR